MKKLFLVSLVLLCALAACTPYMYGVPQESWDRMSEPERITAMQVYEREQQARRQAAEERARRQAIEEQARRQAAAEQARHAALERERAQARQAALERERQERIEAIHQGEGAYGELIRIRLQGGKIRVGDHFHRFEPLTFTIADGETRKIAVVDRQGRPLELTVNYAGGSLALEGVRFPYDSSWGRGRRYADIATSGALELRGVDLFIEVRSRSSRIEREYIRLTVIRDPEPAIVIREKAPLPPIVNRGRELPPPVVVRDPVPPQPLPPRSPAPPVAERSPRSVEVVLLGGELKARGRVQKLERVALRLADGESRDLSVRVGDGAHTISFHYRDGELYIDGTPGRGHDGVRLHYEKEWWGGKVYRVALKGRVALENLDVKVTGMRN